MKKLIIIIIIFSLLIILSCESVSEPEYYEESIKYPEVIDFEIPELKPEKTFEECFVPKSSLCPDCPIVIIADKYYYDALTNEINTWINDIKKDTIKEVILKVYDKQTEPKLIKDDLKNFYLQNNKKLDGVIILGDIKTKNYGPAISSVDEENFYPLDLYYVDFDELCSLDRGEGYFNTKTKSCRRTVNSFYYPFWYARIQPPVNGDQGIKLLKDYLKRNHDYRSNKLKDNDKMLVYAPIEYDNPNFNLDYLSPRNVENIYDISQIDLLEPDKDIYEFDKKFFNSLKQNYEYVFYNGHGQPISQQVGIEPEDIIKNQPQGLFYDFNSCSVGRYTRNNYLAGWYLFSGNGLIAQAATSILFTSTLLPRDEFIAHSVGLSFGEVYRTALSVHGKEILGDPTLKIKNGLKSNSMFCIEKSKLDFGQTNKEKEASFNIYNKGIDELKVLNVIIKLTKAPEDETLAISYWSCDGDVNPNEKLECVFKFLPKTKGYYEGVINLITNDPNNKVVRIPFSAELI